MKQLLAVQKEKVTLDVGGNRFSTAMVRVIPWYGIEFYACGGYVAQKTDLIRCSYNKDDQLHANCVILKCALLVLSVLVHYSSHCVLTTLVILVSLPVGFACCWNRVDRRLLSSRARIPNSTTSLTEKWSLMKTMGLILSIETDDIFTCFWSKWDVHDVDS